MTKNIKLRTGSAWLNLTPIYGTGMPNGVVSAPVGSKYIDTNATNGAVEWVKSSGTGNTGWVVSVGRKVLRVKSADLLNGWTHGSDLDGFTITRTPNHVSFSSPSIVGLNSSAATSNIFYTLPSGYKQTIPGNYPALGLYMAPGGIVKILAGDFSSLVLDRTVTGVHQLAFTFPCNEQWPTS